MFTSLSVVSLCFSTFPRTSPRIFLFFLSFFISSCVYNDDAVEADDVHLFFLLLEFSYELPVGSFEISLIFKFLK